MNGSRPLRRRRWLPEDDESLVKPIEGRGVPVRLEAEVLVALGLSVVDDVGDETFVHQALDELGEEAAPELGFAVWVGHDDVDAAGERCVRIIDERKRGLGVLVRLFLASSIAAADGVKLQGLISEGPPRRHRSDARIPARWSRRAASQS